MRALHRNIRARREELGLTQEQLGTLAGVGETTVSHWERGYAAPTAERLPLVAQALKTTIDDLYVEAA